MSAWKQSLTPFPKRSGAFESASAVDFSKYSHPLYSHRSLVMNLPGTPVKQMSIINNLGIYNGPPMRGTTDATGLYNSNVAQFVNSMKHIISEQGITNNNFTPARALDKFIYDGSDRVLDSICSAAASLSVLAGNKTKLDIIGSAMLGYRGTHEYEGHGLMAVAAGLAHFERGEVKLAATCYKDAIGKFKDASCPHRIARPTILLAECLVLQQNYEEAESLLNPLLSDIDYPGYFPGISDYYFYEQLMYIRYGQQRYQEAVEMAGVAKRYLRGLGEGEAEALSTMLGLCYYRLGYKEDAKDILKKATRVKSYFHEIDLCYATIELFNEDKMKLGHVAAMCLELVRLSCLMEQEKQTPARNFAVNTLIKIGFLPGAEQALAIWVKSEEDITEGGAMAHQHFALLYAKQKDFLNAVHYQKTFIYMTEKLGKSETREMGGHLHDLAALQTRADLLENAEKTFRKTLELKLRVNAPASKTVNRTKRSLAELLIKLKRTEEAQALIEDALKLGGAKAKEEFAGLIGE